MSDATDARRGLLVVDNAISHADEVAEFRELMANDDRVEEAWSRSVQERFWLCGRPDRLESAIALSRLLDRRARIELAGDRPRRRSNLLGRALENLDVRLA